MNWRALVGLRHGLGWIGVVGVVFFISARYAFHEATWAGDRVRVYVSAIIVGVVLGFAFTGTAVGFLSSRSSWTLPGARRSLAAQVPLAVALLVLPIPLAALKFAGPGAALGLFGMGLLSSAIVSLSVARRVGCMAYIVAYHVLHWSFSRSGGWLPSLATDWRIGLLTSLLATVLLARAIPSAEALRHSIQRKTSGGSRSTAVLADQSSAEKPTEAQPKFGTGDSATCVGFLRTILLEAKGRWKPSWLASIVRCLKVAAVWIVGVAVYHYLPLPTSDEETLAWYWKLWAITPSSSGNIPHFFYLWILFRMSVIQTPPLSRIYRLPRARAVLAEATFFSRLLVTLRFALVGTVFLLAQVGGALMFGGGRGEVLSSLLPQFRWFAVLLILLPLDQWVRGSRVYEEGVYIVSFYLFFAQVAGVWLLQLSGWGQSFSWLWVMEALALASLAQLFVWWRLRCHFRRADFIRPSFLFGLPLGPRKDPASG